MSRRHLDGMISTMRSLPAKAGTMLPVLLLISSLPSPVTAEDRISFTESIRPILTRHCSRCHGEKTGEGGLRLHSRQTAFRATDSGVPVIVPGDPEKSLLIHRVTGEADGERMPPDGQPLSVDEIRTLRSWIEQGANWPPNVDGRHWAWSRPNRPTVPVAKGTIHNPVDAFIAARMARVGARSGPPASKPKLLRRLSLTLTGLPPTVDELDEFLADRDAGAYERAVDRLLASPRYGERWAQHWLDLARYADSNGFQADQLRETWAYRDWVIDAFNSGMPFDRFVVEQLAGDMLPNATLAQKIATGFHRTVPCNVEAGVHPEENRTNQVFDRVNTTGTVFLGTTIECAQCHDHKYDPFTQREYYQLFAFFNNTPLEVRLGSGVQYEMDGPKLTLPLSGDQQERRDRLERKLAELRKQRQALAGTDADRRAWERTLLANLDQRKTAWRTLKITTATATGGETMTVLPDQSVLVSGNVPDTTTYRISAAGAGSPVTAVRLEALTHESLPGLGPGRGDVIRNNFILSEFTVRHGSKNPQPVRLTSPRADFSQKGWPVAAAIDGSLKTGWAIAPRFSKPHDATFVAATPVPAGRDLTFTLEQNYGRGRTLGRVRLSVFTGNPAVLRVTPQLARILKRSPKQRTPRQRQQLARLFAASAPEAAGLDRRIDAAQKQLNQIKPVTTLVMEERDQPRPTHVLKRGNYLAPGDRVQAGTPSRLHSFEGYRRNRLGLARWIVSPENPLLARVTVNRWWSEVFGRGLVTTPEDFGTQSEVPTHPQLLDWLAAEFIKGGWSMKHIHKLMVTSAAFRRSAAATRDGYARDPLNRLYTRGPRFRLAAETVRDNALAISGLLSPKMHGPAVMPWQPTGIWRAVGRNAPKWTTAVDENRFRRGVYVVWRRAAPYPSFVNFDAPDRAACVVRRARTNTPLQALTLLNDPSYLEMALSLAHRMISRANDPGRRIQFGFRLCTARMPTDEERRVLQNLYANEARRLSGQPGAAAGLFRSVPGYSVPQDTDPSELAAWFTVANVLLNLDETITN